MTFAGLGNYFLAAAMLASGAGVFFAIWAGRRRSSVACRLAGAALHAITIILTLTSAILMRAIFRNDFSIDYVARHSDVALPLQYKIAAFWGGHEGSLLLWTWLMAVMCSMAIRFKRKDSATDQAPVVALMSGVCWFFCLIMLFVANPFKIMEIVPPDGVGLNPLLQHPAMVAHPVLLFIGYAACVIPFAQFIGALIAGRTDRDWIASVRRWMACAWLFLTSGIILGAWWAYVELGWGGYWGWDPVENASLFPWFTATAAMHSLIAYQYRQRLKIFSAILVPLTLVLCIFGTYMTRTGLVASVHAFPDTGVGAMFMLMMLAITVVSVGAILWRRNLLKSKPLERLYSTDGGMLGASTVMTVMLAVTLLGTLYSVIFKPFVTIAKVQGPEFYNRSVLPIALFMGLMMGFAPMLRFAGRGGKKWRILIPVVGLHICFIWIDRLTWGGAFTRPLIVVRSWTISSAAIVAFI